MELREDEENIIVMVMEYEEELAGLSSPEGAGEERSEERRITLLLLKVPRWAGLQVRGRVIDPHPQRWNVTQCTNSLHWYDLVNLCIKCNFMLHYISERKITFYCTCCRNLNHNSHQKNSPVMFLQLRNIAKMRSFLLLADPSCA